MELYRKEKDFKLALNLKDHGRLHTIIGYDDNEQVYLLIVNIPGNNINEGYKYFDYPMQGKMNFEVFEQRFNIDMDPAFTRDNFNLHQFIIDAQLVSIYNVDPVMRSLKDEVKSTYQETKLWPSHHELMIHGQLTEDQEKFCSCLLKVEAKGSARNPAAVCAKSVGTTVGRSNLCRENYNYDAMSDDLLKRAMNIKKLSIPSPWNRQIALNILKK